MANDAAVAMSGTICRGLIVAGVPVGGLTTDEAERELAAALKVRQEKPLAVLKSGETRWEVPWNAVQGKPDSGPTGKEGLCGRPFRQYAAKNL